MSKYKYIFTTNGKSIESTGYNLLNGAENAGIRITRADSLSNSYLNKTKFEDRVHTVWGVVEGSINNICYTVQQGYNTKY